MEVAFDMNGQTTILYVGVQEQGQVLQQAAKTMGWHVFIAIQMKEALAKYVFYYPTLVILDAEAAPEVTDEVLFHLRSIQAQPVLVLREDVESQMQRKQEDPSVQVLSSSLSTAGLLTQVAHVIACNCRHHQATLQPHLEHWQIWR